MNKDVLILTDCQEYRLAPALRVERGGTNSYERAIFMAFLNAIYAVYGPCYAEVNKQEVLGKGPWNYEDPDVAPKVITFDELYPKSLADVYYADGRKPDFDYRFKCWKGNKRIELPKRTPSSKAPRLFLLNYLSKSKEFDGHWPFLEKQIQEIRGHVDVDTLFVDCSTRLKPGENEIEKLRKRVAKAQGGAFEVDLTEMLRIKSDYSYDPNLIDHQFGDLVVEKFSSVEMLQKQITRWMSAA